MSAYIALYNISNGRIQPPWYIHTLNTSNGEIDRKSDDWTLDSKKVSAMDLVLLGTGLYLWVLLQLGISLWSPAFTPFIRLDSIFLVKTGCMMQLKLSVQWTTICRNRTDYSNSAELSSLEGGWGEEKMSLLKLSSHLMLRNWLVIMLLQKFQLSTFSCLALQHSKYPILILYIQFTGHLCNEWHIVKLWHTFNVDVLISF